MALCCGIDITTTSNQLTALVLNIWAWFVATFVPSWCNRPAVAPAPPGTPVCVVVCGPGGMDQLQVQPLNGRCTLGYNIPNIKGPFVSDDIPLEGEMVIVAVEYFSGVRLFMA
jgi:hypothetical protein